MTEPSCKTDRSEGPTMPSKPREWFERKVKELGEALRRVKPTRHNLTLGRLEQPPLESSRSPPHALFSPPFAVKNVTSLLVFTVGAAVSGVAAQQTIPTVAQSDVKAHVGEVATVCGVIVSISCSDKERRVWFDMDEPYWNGMSIVVAEADRPRLGPTLGRFLLQPLCGTGRIEKHEHGFLLKSKPDDLHQKGPARKVPAGFEAGAYTACDEGATLPRLVHEVKPQYPIEAMRAQIQGRVLVDAVVLPDGRVGDVVVAVPLDKGAFYLDNEAVAVVKKWRFKPGTVHGQPVPMTVSVDIAFNLRERK
ncbi:MAG: energy transducer TonB [Bacteroidales bacterium]